MTPTEIAEWRARFDAHIEEILDSSQDQLRQALELIAWQDKTMIGALTFVVSHLRNLAMMYGIVLTELYPQITDPLVLRNLEFCLAFDDLRPRLDGETEERFRALRRRAWEGLLGPRLEKQGDEN